MIFPEVSLVPVIRLHREALGEYIMITIPLVLAAVATLSRGALAAFGLTSGSSSYTVDTGGDLVYVVSKYVR